MYKVQLTFTPEEQQILAAKANRIGYSVTKYIKLLLGKEVLSSVEEYPVIQLSKKAIKTIDKAMEEHRQGKSIRIESFRELETA